MGFRQRAHVRLGRPLPATLTGSGVAFPPWLGSLAVLLGLSLASLPLAGQAPVRIASSPRCSSCAIRLRPVATVGGAQDRVLLSLFSTLTWASWGEYYAAPMAEPGLVAVYDRTGKQVGSLGRQGSGPGEFHAIQGIVPTARGGVLVNDGPRITLVDRSGRPRHSAQLRAGVGALNIEALPDSRFVLNNFRALAVPRLLLFDTGLKEVRPLGRALSQTVPDRDALTMVLAAGDSGTIIALQALYSYVVEVWDTAGILKRTFVRDAEWFRPYNLAERLRRGPRSPPLPSINSAYCDGAELLWVTGVVADPNWKPREAVGAPYRPVPASALDVAYGRTHYDTMLEALDLKRGLLLATLRLDDVASFVGGGLLAWKQEDDNGVISYRVSRPVLQR